MTKKMLIFALQKQEYTEIQSPKGQPEFLIFIISANKNKLWRVIQVMQEKLLKI